MYFIGLNNNNNMTYDINNHIKGDTFNGFDLEIIIDGEPLDLTDAIIKMQLRRNANASVALEFCTADSSIEIINAAEGKCRIMPRVVDIPAGVYLYDIEVTTGVTVRTVLTGKFSIVPDITH